jgi:hypothetical protein
MKAIGIVVAVAIVVSACAAPGSRIGTLPADCHGADCQAKVIVTRDCVISVDPPYLAVYGREVTIHWDLEADAVYTFASVDGIVMKANDGHFTNGMPTAQNRKYIWHDSNPPNAGKPTYYPYGVKLMKNGVACAQFDPGIINQG